MLGNGGLGEFQGSNFLYSIGVYGRDLESINYGHAEARTH